MPRGGEATHGFTDHKEGMYFGPEHEDSHHHAGLPLVCTPLALPVTSFSLTIYSMARINSQIAPYQRCVLRGWNILTR